MTDKKSKYRFVWWGWEFDGWGLHWRSWKGLTGWAFHKRSIYLGPLEIRREHDDMSVEAMQSRYDEVTADD